MTRTALLTGCTGQDGSWLAELLLSKGYCVTATRRRASTPNLSRIEHILTNPNLSLTYADLTDRSSLRRVVKEVQPDEVYNLAAQSDVSVSFAVPAYTRATIFDGTMHLLGVLQDEMRKPFKVLLAASSEQFGNSPPPQNEQTPFAPVSPYARAKVDAFNVALRHRAEGMFVSHTICFNHEGSRRGAEFVTRKITRALGRMACGLQETCTLGDLRPRRDWGHARDYIEAMWLALQQDKPDDFVIATGETHSVNEFLVAACDEMAELIDCDYMHRFKVDATLFRPIEVHCLQGDASKAREVLGWKPKTDFVSLVQEMVAADYELARIEALCKAGANLRQDTRT